MLEYWVLGRFWSQTACANISLLHLLRVTWESIRHSLCASVGPLAKNVLIVVPFPEGFYLFLENWV